MIAFVDIFCYYNGNYGGIMVTREEILEMIAGCTDDDLQEIAKFLEELSRRRDNNSGEKIKGKETIEYKDFDWLGFLYTDSGGLNSYFNSIRAGNCNIDDYVFMFNRSVEKVGDKYIVTFVPRCLNTVISREARGVNNGFIQLEMTLDELKHFRFSEDMDINLSGNKSLIGEIKKRAIYGCDSDMPKVLIPFSKDDISLKKEDIIFAKILFDFVENFRKTEILTFNFSASNFSILFTNNGNNLSFSDVLEISRILGSADVGNFVLDASINYHMKEIKTIDYDLYRRRNNSILVNGLKRENEKDKDARVLTLDISKGLCSRENIVNLYRFAMNSFKSLEKISRSYYDDNGSEEVSDGYSFSSVVRLHESALEGTLSYRNGKPASKEAYDLVDKMYKEFQECKIKGLTQMGVMQGVDVINDTIQRLEIINKDIYGESLEMSEDGVHKLSLIDSKVVGTGRNRR